VDFGRGCGGLARYAIDNYPAILAALTSRLGLPFGEAVTISLHATEASFDEALASISASESGIAHEPWVAGVAHPGSGRILIRAWTVEGGDLPGFDNLLRHEIAHLVLGTAIRSDNGPHPVWLHEGMAQWATGRLVLGTRLQLSLARRLHALEPFARLEREFPDDRWKAGIAYLQSESLVRYVAWRIGDGGVRRILSRMVAGSNFYRAFRAEVGMEFYDFEKEWLAYLDEIELLPWLLVSSGSFFTIMAALGVVAWILRRRRAVAIRTRWDREEAAMAVAREGERA